MQCLPFSISSTQRWVPNSVDTRRKLNVLCTFNLRPVSTGSIIPPVILAAKMIPTIFENKKSRLSINYHTENLQSLSAFKGTNADLRISLYACFHIKAIP